MDAAAPENELIMTSDIKGEGAPEGEIKSDMTAETKAPLSLVQQ